MTGGMFDQSMTYNKAREHAKRILVLASPTRLQILAVLADGRELNQTSILVRVGRVSQPTIAHHLKIMAEAGFITRRRDGDCVWYRMAADALADVAGSLCPPRRRPDR